MNGATHSPNRLLPDALARILARHQQADCDWLRHHGLAALVAHYGQELPVAETTLRRCTTLASAWTAQFMLLQAAWRSVHDALSDLPTLVLKGAATATSLYPSPELRMVGDLDLLIPPAARDRAATRLADTGMVAGLSQGSGVFTQQAYSQPVSRNVVCHVDLHWALSNRPLLAGAFSFATLWEAAVARGPAKGLADHHEFIHGCMHLLGHHRDDLRLKWLLDLHLRWSSADSAVRESIVTDAVNRGLAPLVLTTLNLCQQHLGTEITERRRQQLQRCAGQPSARLLGGGSETWQDLLTAPGGLRGRSLHLYGLLFPPRQYMRARYGPGWLPAQYLRRWLRGASQSLGRPA